MVPPFLRFHVVMVATIVVTQQQIQLLYFMGGKTKLFFLDNGSIRPMSNQTGFVPARSSHSFHKPPWKHACFFTLLLSQAQDFAHRSM